MEETWGWESSPKAAAAGATGTVHSWPVKPTSQGRQSWVVATSLLQAPSHHLSFPFCQPGNPTLSHHAAILQLLASQLPILLTLLGRVWFLFMATWSKTSRAFIHHHINIHAARDSSIPRHHADYCHNMCFRRSQRKKNFAFYPQALSELNQVIIRRGTTSPIKALLSSKMFLCLHESTSKYKARIG